VEFRLLGLGECRLPARVIQSGSPSSPPARAKGLREGLVLFKHALRNASIPLVTILGFQFGRVLGGAIVTETVFAWPGVASLAVKAIRTYDYPVVQASVVLLALIIVVVNLLTDIVIAYLDPRIRYGARAA
jgi:peptide/nickel transport system permease protein